MNNTPIDEYYFWKNLIEEKQDACQPVPDKMFELLALAETKMLYFLMDKHHSSDSALQPAYQH